MIEDSEGMRGVLQEYAKAMASHIDKQMFNWNVFRPEKQLLPKYKGLPRGKRRQIAVAIRMAGYEAARKSYGKEGEKVKAVYYCDPSLKGIRRRETGIMPVWHVRIEPMRHGYLTKNVKKPNVSRKEVSQ